MTTSESLDTLLAEQAQAARELASWESLLSAGKVMGIVTFLIALYMFFAPHNRGWMK